MASAPRHGQPARGWVKYSSQVPQALARKVRGQRSRVGDSKLSTTAGLALIASLSPESRDELLSYIAGQTYGDPSRLVLADVRAKFLTLTAA